jgi:hypothetical protein
MSSFAVFHERVDKSRLLPLPGQRVGHFPRLFITDVPKGVTTQQIYDVLRKSGRDPALMDVSLNHIFIAPEQQWPADIKVHWGSTSVEHVPWQGLQEEAEGWRRITIRIAPQILTRAQAEADRRQQSLTQFCIDSIQAQIGTRSHRIEAEIFSFFFSGGYSASKRSTSLPSLNQWVTRTISDCTHLELVHALKRLHPKFIGLEKWDGSIPPGRFRSYEEYRGNDEEFFYRAEFRIEVTAEGRPYSEALNGSTRAIDGFLHVLRSDSAKKTLSVMFAPLDSVGGPMNPHQCANAEELRAFLNELGLVDYATERLVEEAVSKGSSHVRIALSRAKTDLI